MKVNKKQIMPSVLVAAAIISGGTYLAITNSNTPVKQVAFAYTSALNNQDPATVPDSYVVNIPDANLKAALNAIIASETSTTRNGNQNITAGEMKSITGNGANFNETGVQNFLSRKSIRSLEGLQFLTNAETINLGVNLLSEENALQPISGLTKLKHLNLFHTFRDGNSSFVPSINILAPIKDLPMLESLHLNTNNLTAEHIAILKDTPKLRTLLIAGNNITNIQSILANGFTALNQTSTFSSQKHSITLTKDQNIFKNPITGIDGQPIPVKETVEIKNANSDGALNPTGDYIKLVNLYDKGTKTAKWESSLTQRFGSQKYTGDLIINFELPPMDADGPVFSPKKPAKIVSRKGVGIIITDVIATDEISGLSPSGITNNVNAINLNISNPTKGNYTLTYSASDNAGNTSTVNREIEITDADDLQAKLIIANDELLSGNTKETQDEVVAKKKIADDIIAKNDSTQQQIDDALQQLTDAINNLRADKQPIEAVKNNYNTEPNYVQTDPAVESALVEADRVNGLENPTKEQVKKAADDLTKAIYDAKKKEAAQQGVATNILNLLKGDKATRIPEVMQLAEESINKIRDEAVRNQLLDDLQKIKDEYSAKKEELKKLINTANDPTTIDGMDYSTTNTLRAERQDANDRIYSNPSIDQKSIETAIENLKAAIDGLRADKTPIADALGNYNNQPDFIKNNPEVKEAVKNADAILAETNPSADSVKGGVESLNDAINKAIEKELAAQNTAKDSLEKAIEKIENVAKDELPAVDVEAIQAEIDKIQDPAVKADVQAKLDKVKAEIESIKSKISADKLKEAEEKAKEELKKPSEKTNSEGKVKAPSTGVAKEDDPLLMIFGGFLSIISLPVVLFTKKRK